MCIQRAPVPLARLRVHADWRCVARKPRWMLSTVADHLADECRWEGRYIIRPGAADSADGTGRDGVSEAATRYNVEMVGRDEAESELAADELSGLFRRIGRSSSPTLQADAKNA